MTRTSISAFTLIGICFLLLCQWRQLPASDVDKGKPSEEVQKFAPGILVMNTIMQVGGQSTQTYQFVTDASLIKVGNRYFVRGGGHTPKRLQDGDKWKWYEGKEVCYAWDGVQQYMTLNEENLERFLAAADKSSD